MIYKLGTIVTHVGSAPPEVEPWGILSTLGIDADLARKAVHKLYFEQIDAGYESYSMYYNVFFIPNDTKHGSFFAIKYGAKLDE